LLEEGATARDNRDTKLCPANVSGNPDKISGSPEAKVVKLR
jgi:hypothetical protein